MCTITATEFKENFGKYLELGRKEDILVTKNGKPLVRIVSAACRVTPRLLRR